MGNEFGSQTCQLSLIIVIEPEETGKRSRIALHIYPAIAGTEAVGIVPVETDPSGTNAAEAEDLP